MPYIMISPDSIEKGSEDVTGRKSVRFIKRLGNGMAVVVEKEQKNSPDDMEAITMWAEKSSNVSDARSKVSPEIDVRGVIIGSDDIAKIVKDAENAIAQDKKADKVKSLRDGNRAVYGWTEEGKIYLNRDKINPETPIHEYSHIWFEGLRVSNTELYQRGVALMKGLPVWDEVKNDPAYPGLANDHEIASECLARLVGRRVPNGLRKSQDRNCLFGEIVDGDMVLNDAGRMVEKWYYKTEEKFINIRCLEMVVMPNHFHCIWQIDNIPTIPVGADPRVCPNCTEHRSGEHHSGEHVGSPQHRVVQWFKTMTTNEYIRGVKNLNWTPFNQKLWQRNYYEHIIRNVESYKNIAEYITDNPANWQNDKFYYN